MSSTLKRCHSTRLCTRAEPLPTTHKKKASNIKKSKNYNVKISHQTVIEQLSSCFSCVLIALPEKIGKSQLLPSGTKYMNTLLLVSSTCLLKLKSRLSKDFWGNSTELAEREHITFQACVCWRVGTYKQTYQTIWHMVTFLSAKETDYFKPSLTSQEVLY